MKLKEYMVLREPGDEVTCWDKDVDSEFYFYNKEVGESSLYGDDFPYANKCDELLREHLDVVKIRDDGIEVNLYELMENPKVIEFAKKYMFNPTQYKDDSDVSMMLFDDNVSNFSNGFENFSEMMVSCLNYAFGLDKVIENVRFVSDFYDDEDKMIDFFNLSKSEFLKSYSYLTEAEYDATMVVVNEKLNKGVKERLDNVISSAEITKNMHSSKVIEPVVSENER